MYYLLRLPSLPDGLAIHSILNHFYHLNKGLVAKIDLIVRQRTLGIENDSIGITRCGTHNYINANANTN